MSKWKKVKLGDLGSVNRGKSRHRPRNDKSLYGGKYPFVQTADIKSAEFYVSGYSQTYNEKGLAQSKIWPNNTLCITIAANIAESAILKMPACFPDSIVGFIADDEKSDVKFVKYAIDFVKNKMQLISKGTTQDNLSVDKLLSIDFSIPEDIKEQRKIAGVLSTYDDLIEVNNRRIAILESQAQKIYNEWFVKFKFPGHKKTKIKNNLPEGWEEKKVEDFVDFVRGVEPGSKNYKNTKKIGTVPFLRVGDLGSRNSNIFIKEELAKEKIVKYDDIVVSMDGTVGIVKMGMDGAHSTGIRKLKIKDNKINKSFLYTLMLSDNIQDTIKRHAQGATILHASKSIEYMTFILPPQKIMNNFEVIVEPMLTEMLNLQKINSNLRKTRDKLLPKLISGEIEVK